MSEIKTDLRDRMRSLLNQLSPQRFFSHTNVISSIDYHKLNINHRRIVTGNVTGTFDVTLTPDTGKYYKILYWFGSLTTNAVAANRYIRFKITDSNSWDLLNTRHKDAVPASTNQDFLLSPLNSGDILQTAQNIGYNQPIEVYENQVFTLDIMNGQAGDSWYVSIKFLELEIHPQVDIANPGTD